MKQLIYVSLIGISIILLLSNHKLVKQVSIVFSLLLFVKSVKLCFVLDKMYTYQQILVLYWGKENQIIFGIDPISTIFILLTTLLIVFCVLVGYETERVLEKEYYISLFIVELLLICVFSVLDLLGFYILYEAILLPMFYVIGVWGSRKQKITASMYFFFYTLVGSILMLISIIYLYYLTGTTNFLILNSLNLDLELEKILFLGLMSSLVVKVPMYPFHI